MDRNKNEWAVGFHGSTQEGTQSVTQTRVFKAGQRQLYSNDIDTNKLSDNFGRPCGVGIYFSAEVEISERYSQFKIDGAKCVLQACTNCIISGFPTIMGSFYNGG